jgi:16S rRNA C967 or C1407 C5-methylase (RsmB/RsmF family)
MHELQKEILIRGLTLLKVGGRLVYSTCSFNPIENEAVVCAAIKHLGHSKVRLINAKKEVSPELKCRPGLLRWKVYHKARGKYHPAEWYSSFDEVPEERRERCKESMFHESYTLRNN